MQAHDRLGHRGRHARLHHGRDALGAARRRRGAPLDGLGQTPQALLELAVNRRVPGRELFAVREQVLPAQVDGVASEAVGRDVHHRLHAPDELRHAEPAEGAARRGVGVDGVAVQLHVRDAVGPGRGVRPLLDHARRDVGIGADVVVGLAGERGHAPVAVEGEGEPHAGAAPAHGPEGILHRREQPHRPAGHSREGGSQRLELRVGLAAEAAAQQRHGDSDAAGVQRKHCRQLRADRERVLRRRPHGEAALVVPVGQRAVRLHGVVLDAGEPVGVLEHEVGAGERLPHVAAGVVELVADVGPGLRPQRGEVREVPGQRLTGVHQGGAGRQRLLQRRHRRQLLVLHLDEVQRLRRRRLVHRGNRHHRLALVADDLAGQEGPVAQGGPVERVAEREVGGGQDGIHARHLARRAHVHAEQARVRIRRAQQARVRHARQLHVAEIPRAARDLLERVRTAHGLANDPEAARGAGHDDAAFGVAHARMASRIFR